MKSVDTIGMLVVASCAVALLASCRTSGPMSPPAATVESAPVATPAASSARAAAQAEVARLTAIADQDPLLAAWPGDYGGVPPWDKLNVAVFGKAFETGLALVLAEVDVIAENPEPPTFTNTFVPLEDAGRHTDRSQTLFSILTNNLSTPEVQALDKEWSPKIAAAYDKIVFNQKLFARVAAIHAARDKSNLNPEQRRLVELTYDRLVRAGANLSADDKAKVGKINEELAGLFTDFGNKVLADENTWTVLESQKDLAGLSPSLIAAYKAAADERNLAGKWAVVNTRSSVDPFLTSSSRRDLREKVWNAFKNRGDNGGENDTNATIARIVKLRAERAKLLGYPTHAHWRMADTMAGDPEKAKTLMMRVWPAAVARVGEEVKDMERLASRDGLKGPFEPWDYLYYAEKVRKAKYDLDQDELKPYFELNNMIAGSFHMAEQLYGLTFTEITGKVPVFLEGVRVWEVKDKATGAHVGLFYGDYFARKGKRSGAWASGYRGRETFTGKTITPITSNNNNFVRGAPGEPVLISLDDAETLFHEFGHAIHSLVSQVNYPGLATTPRDFVEYPSQVHEMWVLTRPILDKFAKHYKTGKPMPDALVKKVDASSKFNQGYTTVEYLESAIVDMEMHTKPDGVVDADAFEREILQKIGAPREVALRHRLPQFNHLFTSDSYSAGYYSYLWSEVMDADTREAFLEAGNVFDPTVAGKMRQFILAPGNSTDRAQAYRQFRGRDPDVTALLKKRGFPTN
ncbi:MAG TPA: M3 family metallopeptidase [Thermoanaerobaculia bacterium]|nr:M3 family metallopeptidase [Thermoanaerobaculia bacterium]